MTMTLEALAPGDTFPAVRTDIGSPRGAPVAPAPLHQTARVETAPSVALYAETLSLACVIAAVAGLLPLVMMLHR
jgi:hypothetical protein